MRGLPEWGRASPHAELAFFDLSNKVLDTGHRVTVWLHIMRNRSVTYSAEATFQALADPTRRAVLDLLRRRSHATGHRPGGVPGWRPPISKHLRRRPPAPPVRAPPRDRRPRRQAN